MGLLSLGEEEAQGILQLFVTPLQGGTARPLSRAPGEGQGEQAQAATEGRAVRGKAGCCPHEGGQPWGGSAFPKAVRAWLALPWAGVRTETSGSLPASVIWSFSWQMLAGTSLSFPIWAEKPHPPSFQMSCQHTLCPYRPGL